MTVSVYVPAALSLLLAAISRIAVARTAPTRAAAFVIAAMLCAAAATWGLVLLAATLLGYTSLVADEALEHGVQLHDPVLECEPAQRPGQGLAVEHLEIEPEIQEFVRQRAGEP